MHTFILKSVCAFFFLITSAYAQQSLPTQKFTIGMHVIQAEIAATDAHRQIGLMHRTEMPQNGGMMFRFDQPAIHCMWMKNTLIPLSVAFMDGDGVILNIEEMQPHSEKNHCAVKPALYALEMNAGWFKKRNIKAGSKVESLQE